MNRSTGLNKRRLVFDGIELALVDPANLNKWAIPGGGEMTTHELVQRARERDVAIHLRVKDVSGQVRETKLL